MITAMQIITLAAVLGVQLQLVQLFVSLEDWYVAEVDWTYMYVSKLTSSGTEKDRFFPSNVFTVTSSMAR